jgi:hypothetical protein
MEVAGEYLRAFPGKQQIHVYRQSGIGGLKQLGRLGQDLYQPAGAERFAYAAS